MCHRCRWYRWCTLTCDYLREFSKKFETILMQYSGAGGKLIHQKSQKQKISWHCPFNLHGWFSVDCICILKLGLESASSRFIDVLPFFFFRRAGTNNLFLGVRKSCPGQELANLSPQCGFCASNKGVLEKYLSFSQWIVKRRLRVKKKITVL